MPQTDSRWVGIQEKHRGDPIEEKDLKPKQFKARVVIRGQYMREGLDFNDTFAPVAKPMTIRAVLAVATKHGCKLKAGDVETWTARSGSRCHRFGVGVLTTSPEKPKTSHRAAYSKVFLASHKVAVSSTTLSLPN
jgi:hypothetical protein